LKFNYQVIAFEDPKDDTEDNVVKLMAALNSVAKTWSPINYVRAYCTLEGKTYTPYREFREIYDSHNLPASTILCVLTNDENFTKNDRNGFYSGRLKIRKKSEFQNVLKALLEVREVIPNGAKCQCEMIYAIRDYSATEKVSEMRIAEVLINYVAKQNEEFEFPKNKEQFRETLRNILDIKFT
jgi:hypothetical protein